jgi:hypothetical protein
MSEETKELSVSDMLKLTGSNTADFMKRIADHVDELENRISMLKARISELEIQNELGVEGINSNIAKE